MRTQNPQFAVPTPNDDDLRRVEPLLDFIQTEINNNGGKISFDRFMEIALYTDALGYYTGNNIIFGDKGDFVTAPELTPLFSRCIARQVKQVLENFENNADILEFGAGAGTLACDVLMELEKLDALPRHYYIVEISPTLQSRQRSRISTYAPHLVDRVTWVKEAPAEFDGVVLGNEILDAIPTHRVRIHPDGQCEELFVTVEQNRFAWAPGEFKNDELKKRAQKIYQQHGQNFSGPYDTEINLQAFQWVESLASSLNRGVIILIDYGFADSEFYRPERYEGTLMCHYKHSAHGDALIHVGLQDITSHVNFTQIAEAAFASGLEIKGFTSQMFFLIACGLEGLLSEIDLNDTTQFIKETQPVKQLILPDEMGELFKVIALAKNFEPPLLGFSMNNQIERL